MAYIHNGYLVRRSSKGVSRDWWLVKKCGHQNLNSTKIDFKAIHLPNKYIGKRVRIKCEIEVI